jgi:hypothetical protein
MQRAQIPYNRNPVNRIQAIKDLEVHARTIYFILLAKYHVNFRSKKNKNKKACSYYNTVANFKVELQPKGPSSEANFKMIKEH